MKRCDIVSDGETPLHRLQGRRDNTPILVFVDKILYMPTKPARGGEGDLRFYPGVFVGMLNSSSEAVSSPSKGWRSRHARAANVRIIPESERWDADRILGMRAIPGSLNSSDNAFDIQIGMERPAEVEPRSPGEVLMEKTAAKTFLRRADFERWTSVKVVVGART